VRILDSNSFRQLVKKDRQFALVEFYADWCGHCQAFAPEFEKVARGLAGIVNVYAVSDSTTGSEEGVQGYPTIKLYSGGKSVNYMGERSAEPVIDFVFEKAKGITKKRLNKKTESKKKEEKKKDKKKEEKKKDKKEDDDESQKEFKNDFEDMGSDVATLTVRNFTESVVKSEEPWFVMFYSNGCPKCQQLNPIWKTIGYNNKPYMKIGRIDCGAEASIAREYGITNFPTVLMFPRGRKQSPLEYKGDIEIFEMKKWALHNRGFETKPIQLLSDSQFQSECADVFCAVVVVPNILDSNSKERESFLNIIASAANDASTHAPVKYFWIEGGISLAWESDLRLQFGWPAVVMMNLQNDKYWTHKGLFQIKSIQTFLQTSTLERPPFEPIPKNLTPLKTVNVWNGEEIKSLLKKNNEL